VIAAPDVIRLLGAAAGSDVRVHATRSRRSRSAAAAAAPDPGRHPQNRDKSNSIIVSMIEKERSAAAVVLAGA
jgi:hypothetical protein